MIRSCVCAASWICCRRSLGRCVRLAAPGRAALVGLLLLALGATSASAYEIPSWLPHYDLDMHVDLDKYQVHVHQRVTWTNRHNRPAEELVFNAHSHYKVPDADIGFTAKMMEILRITPSQGLDFEGHACQVQHVTLGGADLPFRFEMAKPELAKKKHKRDDCPPSDTVDSLATDLVVQLPAPVQPGQTIQVDLEITMQLPEKQGRWGHWKGVTFLVNWLPVLAVYDEHGWHPTPFIPWHLPFFNEAGIYSARVTLPCDQTIACSSTIMAARDLGNGMQQVDIAPCCVRDFAFICSKRWQEFTGQAGGVKVRVLAFPEHEYYAREMVRIACEAIPVYSSWFGPFPYPEFTIAESYFGWNGNQLGDMVMIDERIFDMPHLALPYVEYLVSHEICHQWWYNVVGVNGYCESWMDEGLATYFSHRLMNQKCGKNNQLLNWPAGLEWLPSVYRENYRYYGLYGTIARGEYGPTVQDMEKFGHIVNLFSMTYDKGSKIVGMIEDRLGEAAFLDFMRIVYARYYFRILRVADFQHELEEYTGKSWKQFFDDWLYGCAITDWAIDKVHIDKIRNPKSEIRNPKSEDEAPPGARCCQPGEYRVTVVVKQKADYTEPTVLGFCLDDSDEYQVRVPIVPQAQVLELDNPPARVETLPDNCVRVEITLPCKPTQIAVDPDEVLIDRNPANNFWKKHIKWRIAPAYTFLEETDLTNSYDHWNGIVGPWFYSPLYDDPWFTRSTMLGVRAGLYRTQTFNGGVYTAYRTDYEDLVAGVDGTWDHFPFDHTQVGFILERRLSSAFRGDDRANRGVIWGRYIFDYGDSLYLPPMHYVDVYGTVQDDLLPYAREFIPGSLRPDHQGRAGFHYHINYLTPYWDPEGGFQFDLTYGSGITVPGVHDHVDGLNELSSQFSMVHYLPEGLGWLSETRVAARLYGAAGLPTNYQLFTLGGDTLFRGFDIAQRQGSMVWIGSVEWRVPVARGLTWDALDHTVGLRNIYLAPFYDVGDIYGSGHSVGGVAQAAGIGLRLDMAWLSFIERSVFRIDVAKTVNANTPWQVWLGIQQPF